MNYLETEIWQIIGTFFQIGAAVFLILLFKRKPIYSQKVLLIGSGFFILTVFFNVIGFEEISDYFSVLGFLVILLSLIRLFWSDTSEKE